MQEKTLEELLKELRWLPSGGGCVDASCEGCEWEEKERARVEGEITGMVEKAREEGRKEGFSQMCYDEAKNIGRMEERQFILNVLDGIDIADKQMGIVGGTQAIRFALKNRII